MPIYFFDTRDNEMLHLDEDGLSFRDDEAAKREALRAMADLAGEYLPTFGPSSNKLVLNVREGRRVVLELELSFNVLSGTVLPFQLKAGRKADPS